MTGRETTDAANVAIFDYRFVDPALWDGVGVTIISPRLIKQLCEIFAEMERRIVRGDAPDHFIKAVASYAPTENRTQLVRVQIAGPRGKN